MSTGVIKNVLATFISIAPVEKAGGRKVSTGSASACPLCWMWASRFARMSAVGQP